MAKSAISNKKGFFLTFHVAERFRRLIVPTSLLLSSSSVIFLNFALSMLQMTQMSCVGVPRSAWVCTDVPKCAWVYTGVSGCARVCAGVCGTNFQNTYWRIDS